MTITQNLNTVSRAITYKLPLETDFYATIFRSLFYSTITRKLLFELFNCINENGQVYRQIHSIQI